jgi:hypothetical protein
MFLVQHQQAGPAPPQPGQAIEGEVVALPGGGQALFVGHLPVLLRSSPIRLGRRPVPGRHFLIFFVPALDVRGPLGSTHIALDGRLIALVCGYIPVVGRFLHAL